MMSEEKLQLVKSIIYKITGKTKWVVVALSFCLVMFFFAKMIWLGSRPRLSNDQIVRRVILAVQDLERKEGDISGTRCRLSLRPGQESLEVRGIKFKPYSFYLGSFEGKDTQSIRVKPGWASEPLPILLSNSKECLNEDWLTEISFGTSDGGIKIVSVINTPKWSVRQLLGRDRRVIRPYSAVYTFENRWVFSGPK